MKKIIAIAALTLFTRAVFGQQTFSLKQAIDYSLKNHGSNTIYANQVEQSRLQAQEALSAYMPQVNGNVTYDDNLKRQTTILPGAMFGKDGDIPVKLGNQFNASAVIQVDQTIYDQALIYGVKAGIPAKKVAELNQAKNNEELIYNTAAAYVQVLIFKEQQRLIQANAAQYEELFKVTQYRFDKGVAKKVDLDRVTVQLNNIRSQQKQIQTDITVAYNTLKNAIGLSLNSPLTVADSLDYKKYLQVGETSFDVQQLIDFKLQQQNIALQEIDVKRKVAAYLPTVSAYARYGGQTFSNELDKSVSNWNAYSSVGLKMSVPLFSGNRRQAQLKESKLELQNAKQNIELSSAQLQLQFQNAGRELQENVSTLNANRDNMQLAKTVYETSEFEYSKGVTTMADLLNSDFSYKQAQANYMNSLLNLVANRLKYERAKGSIIQFTNQL